MYRSEVGHSPDSFPTSHARQMTIIKDSESTNKIHRKRGDVKYSFLCLEVQVFAGGFRRYRRASSDRKGLVRNSDASSTSGSVKGKKAAARNYCIKRTRSPARRRAFLSSPRQKGRLRPRTPRPLGCGTSFAVRV